MRPLELTAGARAWRNSGLGWGTGPQSNFREVIAGLGTRTPKGCSGFPRLFHEMHYESDMLETKQATGARMFLGRQTTDLKRKLIEFAPEVWLALDLLAKDTGRSVQDLADEAFGDLLGKYQRPASLKDALRESARRLPANDDVPPLG